VFVKIEPKGSPLLLAALSVWIAGGLAWIFPRVASARAGEWLTPGLACAALVLTVVMAWPWRLLRVPLLTLALMLVVSWNHGSATSTSHFAGASLGCLAMVTVGAWAQTPWRLRMAMLVFLCSGAAILLVGLAGAAIPPPVRSALTYLPAKLPSIRLGLAGLDKRGEVNPNALASVVLLVLPLAIAVTVHGRRRRIDRWTLLPAAVAVVAVGTMTLGMTLSRTALIAVWLMALGLLVRGMRSPLHRLVAGAIVLAPLLILTARLAFVITQDEAYIDAQYGWVSARSRTQIQGQALDMWRQSPWLGIGLNEFRHEYAARPGDIPQEADIAHAHNIVLQTALDIGLVGSLAYWTVLGVLWVRASQAAGGRSKTARAAAIGGAFSLIGVTLFGLTDAVPLGAKIGTLQWIAGGLILASWHVRLAPSDADDDTAADSRKSIPSVVTA
jgi:O-antigen ligase